VRLSLESVGSHWPPWPRETAVISETELPIRVVVAAAEVRQKAVVWHIVSLETEADKIERDDIE